MPVSRPQELCGCLGQFWSRMLDHSGQDRRDLRSGEDLTERPERVSAHVRRFLLGEREGCCLHPSACVDAQRQAPDRPASSTAPVARPVLPIGQEQFGPPSRRCLGSQTSDHLVAVRQRNDEQRSLGPWRQNDLPRWIGDEHGQHEFPRSGVAPAEHAQGS